MYKSTSQCLFDILLVENSILHSLRVKICTAELNFLENIILWVDSTRKVEAPL